MMGLFNLTPDIHPAKGEIVEDVEGELFFKMFIFII